MIHSCYGLVIHRNVRVAPQVGFADLLLSVFFL